MLDEGASGFGSRRPPRDRTSALTRKQLEQFRQLLLKRRAEIMGDVNSMETGALRSGNGDSGNAPMHMADAGSDTFEQEFTLQLAASEREMLREIDEALKRIENGSYGVCEVTGRLISMPRLQAKPWARVSIEVARERDRYHRFRF
jgi:RNA polymerase-binding protein DksA